MNILNANVAKIWKLSLELNADIGVARDMYIANLNQSAAVYGDEVPQEETSLTWNSLDNVERGKQKNDFMEMVRKGDNYETLCILFREGGLEDMTKLATEDPEPPR